MNSEARLEQMERRLEQVQSDYSELAQLLRDLAHETSAAKGQDAAGVMEQAETPDDAGALCGWAEAADAQSWIALMEWADWFMQTYQTSEPSLMGCWPHHPGVVEDLAGLKMSWEQAASACAQDEWRGNEAMAYWHDRYLPGFFQRLRATHGMNRCATTHEQLKARPVVTERDAAVMQTTGQVFS